MKSAKNKSNRGGLFVLVTAFFQCIWVNAQAQQSLVDKMGVSGSEMNSLYIIGSVLVLGIVGYIVYSIIDKNRKPDNTTTNRPNTHRHHNHHRVIKKSS